MPRKYRVGLLPTIEDDNAQHMHRAALVLTRAPHDVEYYGRAIAGHLGEAARCHRLPEIGALMVWGNDEAAVGRLMLRTPHAMMVVVLPKKPKKGGKLLEALGRLASSGIEVHVLTISAKAKAVGWDVGAGRLLEPAPDLRRPPQEQHAPNVNQYRRTPAGPSVAPHSAPSTSQGHASGPSVAPHSAPSTKGPQ